MAGDRLLIETEPTESDVNRVFAHAFSARATSPPLSVAGPFRVVGLGRRGSEPVRDCRLRRVATALGASGTMYSSRIDILAAGIRHSAALRSSSFHSMFRSSPGRKRQRR
jgi:hypothetical protein